MKRLIYLSFAILLAFFMSSTGFAESSKDGYSPPPVQGIKYKGNLLDVNNHWASKDIEFVIQEGIMQGYPEGTFKPNQHINRLELAVVLDRLFNFNFDTIRFIKQPELKDKFDDVYDGNWYSASLLETTFYGVLDNKDRKFRPNDPVTRIEVAKAIQKSFEAKDFNVVMTEMFPIHEDTKTLQNEDISALSFVFNTGIMKGKANNTFGPNEPITRAELATVIKRTKDTLKIANNEEVAIP